jgi:hypothetical protein
VSVAIIGKVFAALTDGSAKARSWWISEKHAALLALLALPLSSVPTIISGGEMQIFLLISRAEQNWKNCQRSGWQR